MARKSRRQVRKGSSPARSNEASGTSRASARAVEREFNPDYSNVIKDLRRIGMLAGGFFVLLIALSFFLN